MTLAPRAVIVHRRTELEELLERHGTRGQAGFFLAARGRSLDDVDARQAAVDAALAAVSAEIPLDWRRGEIERADLERFVFGPDDIVVVVGQDGLVANAAKYLDGQPVIGVNPEPDRNPGVLVAHAPDAFGDALRDVAAGSARYELRAMVEASLDDGQTLVGLNEVFIGHPSHQSARYRLVSEGAEERQSSSGVIVSTGTGATGWCRSIWQQSSSALTLPDPAAARLVWFVREAWPSPATGTSLVEGELGAGESLRLIAESDGLVVFGDGIETDRLTLTWGQEVKVQLSRHALRLAAVAAANGTATRSAHLFRKRRATAGTPSPERRQRT